MAPPHPTEARFSHAAPADGLYESFYLKACHPSEPLGLWIRYTVHKRPDGRPQGSVWVTLFDAAAAGPLASKVTIPEPAAGGGAWLRVGDSRVGEGEAVGSVPGEQAAADWELAFESPEGPLFHLPRDWMYTAGFPRTKPLSPVPAAAFSGRISFAGREHAVDGWRGMVGHNWGSGHAERWIWLHGLGFEGSSGSTWLDAALGKVRLGPLTTPWIGNGALSLDGERLPLGGPGRRVKMDERPDGCEFTLPGKDVTVHGTVEAERKDFVGWVYADPDGPEHHTVNCSIADMTLRVEREGEEPFELRLAGGAAYELGMRERDHGMEIQPFPDG